jgi:hypothetical protein
VRTETHKHTKDKFSMYRKLLSFSSVFLFVFIISISAFVNPSLSDGTKKTTEIKNTDGQSMGNFISSHIDRSDARLTIKIDDKYVDWIRAGHIGNGTYREYWAISKLKSSTSIEVNDLSGKNWIFLKSRVNKDSVKKFLFDRSHKGGKFSTPGRMQSIQEVKLRSNLYYILAKDSYNDVNCAFVHSYWGQVTDLDGLGNKSLMVIVCDPEQLRDPKSSLSEALYILGSAKYGGNKLRIGYKFPTKRDVEILGGIFSSSLSVSSTPSKTAPSNLDNKIDGVTQVPVALMVGESGPFIGNLEYPRKNAEEGDLKFNGGKEVGSCSGKWQRKGNNFGVWYASCDSGLSASGSYQMTGRAKGSGEGVDSKGRQLKLTIGY